MPVMVVEGILMTIVVLVADYYETKLVGLAHIQLHLRQSKLENLKWFLREGETLARTPPRSGHQLYGGGPLPGEVP